MRINLNKIQTTLLGLKMRFPNGISTPELKSELKRLGVSYNGYWQSAFKHANVIYKLKYGIVGINPDFDKITKAYDFYKQKTAKYQKESIKVKVFNKEVEHKITVEEAKLFLEKKGWFVYRPISGEVLTLERKIKF